MIDAPDFEVGQRLRFLALQGDWGLTEVQGPNGSRYVVDERDRAHQCCLSFLGHLALSRPNVALVPELAVPKETVPAIIDAVRNLPQSIVFLAGVEGLTRAEYRLLLSGIGTTQPLHQDAKGDYVNSALILVKTPTKFVAELRAKRIASRAENAGPLMAHGAGPFIEIRLGASSLSLVPIICSEFVWTQPFWENLRDEIGGVIDFMPILQHTDENDAQYTSPEIHRAHTQAAQTKDTRFVFANQAIGDHCDGACYVVVPPGGAAKPVFDFGFNELWHLPGAGGHKGFRVPDTSGCIWSASVNTRHVPTTALGARLCEGIVEAILSPLGERLQGLPAGLMRTAAATHIRTALAGVTDDIRLNFCSTLDPKDGRYLLRLLTTDIANEVFFKMICGDSPRWESVEAMVRDLVEAAALLSTAGDNVTLASGDGGNCRVGVKSASILYAPNVDVSLNKRFGTSTMLDAGGIPLAIVLVGVVIGSSIVGAQRVGDILRSDRVTSPSQDLVGIPSRVENSAVTLRIDDVEFRLLSELRPNLHASDIAAVRGRLEVLFPKVYEQ